jgi:hypothetical protein
LLFNVFLFNVFFLTRMLMFLFRRRKFHVMQQVPAPPFVHDFYFIVHRIFTIIRPRTNFFAIFLTIRLHWCKTILEATLGGSGALFGFLIKYVTMLILLNLLELFISISYIF